MTSAPLILQRTTTLSGYSSMAFTQAIDRGDHNTTKHSVISVQLDPNYVDARTQPASFKTYPHFFRRFPLTSTHPIHQFLSLTSTITYQKTIPRSHSSITGSTLSGGIVSNRTICTVTGHQWYAGWHLPSRAKYQ
jgi:hypothetical protein